MGLMMTYTAMYPAMHSNQVVPEKYNTGPDVVVPVSLLLDLHNAAAEGHPMRTVVVDYIGAFAAANNKAHWTRAVVRKEDGSLAFDEKLWDVAVYLGKQETRMETSQKAFAELRDELDLLHAFMEEEKKLLSELPANAPSAALLPMPEPSMTLQYVRQHTEELGNLVADMHCGLANNISGTTKRALLQRLESEDRSTDEGGRQSDRP